MYTYMDKFQMRKRSFSEKNAIIDLDRYDSWFIVLQQRITYSYIREEHTDYHLVQMFTT